MIPDKIRPVVYILAGVLAFFIFMETAVRIIIDLPAKTDFYSSIPREEIPGLQRKVGVKTVTGPGWIHLGWIANPEKESYRVYQSSGKGDVLIGETRFGSCLVEETVPDTLYTFRIVSGDEGFDHMVSVKAAGADAGPIFVPKIASQWRTLFKPLKSGDYINDHTIFRDIKGNWRLAGITAFGRGDYSKEKYFAHASSRTFPPQEGEMMREEAPLLDYGRLAWAPHVVRDDRFYMWYSPHRAFCAVSDDGIHWEEEASLSFLPFNRQFRDPMVIQVAEGQWLMYATARDGYYSSIDVYQSFDLRRWQYIRPALSMAYGAERAGAQASTESPFVMKFGNRYYLSFTYNNGSFFWNPVMLVLKMWPEKESYNETLVIQSPNPYCFGVYRGRRNPSSLVAELRAHAPEYVMADGKWYITTAGWPWAASLTSGEVAVAGLEWEEAR